MDENTKPPAQHSGIPPGAELFFQYLRAQVGQDLQITGPKFSGTSYNMNFAREYDVLAGGQLIGHYHEWGPKPGEEQAQREFYGRIPGYVNECAVACNRYSLPGENLLPEDLFSVVWANEMFEYLSLKDETADWGRWGHPQRGCIVKTPWQRQDGCDKIPFP